MVGAGPHGPLPFQSSASCSDRTVRTAGLEIHAIEFPPDGGFKLVLNADAATCEINPCDEELDIDPSPPRRGR